MIPTELKTKIASTIQPEDLAEAKRELEAQAAAGKFYLARDESTRELQFRVHAYSIRRRKDRVSRTVIEPNIEDELQQAIKAEQMASYYLMGKDSIYSSVSYSDPNTRHTKVVKHLFEEFHFSGRHNIMILGGVGSGKTFGSIAYVSSNVNLRFTERGEAVLNGLFVRAYTVSEYIQRKNWAALDELRAKKWLIIDDLGIEGAGYKSNDFLSFFEDLFSERHEKQKRTIITCNATPEQALETFGNRFFSRLRETGEIFETLDADMRGKS